MIIEHYETEFAYIISILCVKDFYGDPLSPDKYYFKYITSKSPPRFSCLIDNAITFSSAERAAKWWEENRDVLMKEAEKFGDLSTLKIRKREIRIIEEDVCELT